MIFPPTLGTYLLSLTTLTPLAPLIIHLNADSSWLILLPYPSPPSTSSSSTSTSATSARSRSKRKYFSIILDPWLKGTQTDVHKYLSRQTHLYESVFQSMVEIEEFIERVESIHSGQKFKGKGKADAEEEGEKWIDLVVNSAEFTDHCHRETLEELSKDTRILAADKAASLIRSWNHFDKVLEIPLFDSTSTTSDDEYELPDWIQISRIVAPSEPLYFHSAISIIFVSNSQNTDSDSISTTIKSKRQNILFSPHGLSPSSLPLSLTSSTSSHSASITSQDIDLEEERIETLLLLHGIDTISLLGITINLGYKNALSLIEALAGEVKYWFRTHDEEKLGEGIVGTLLKRIRKKILPVIVPDGKKEELNSSVYKEIENGDWLALV